MRTKSIPAVQERKKSDTTILVGVIFFVLALLLTIALLSKHEQKSPTVERIEGTGG